MRRVSTEGVILKIAVFGESDYVVWVITPAYGVMRLLARRGMKSVKRFGGRLLLFNRLKLDYARRREGEMAAIENAKLVESFAGIFKDEVVFGRCALFAEVLISIWGENDPATDVYEFLLNYLRRSEVGKESADRHVFDSFRLLEILGHRPILDSCSSCGKSLEKSDMYSVNEGGTVCERCADEETLRLAGLGGTIPFEVSAAARRTIEKAYETTPDRLDRVKFSAKARAEAEKLWLAHIQAILNRAPRCAEYLEKLGS